MSETTWQPRRDGTKHGERILWRLRHRMAGAPDEHGYAEWDATPGPDDDDGPCWVDTDGVCVEFDEFIPYPEETTP